MEKDKSFLVLGGDLRQIRIASGFFDDGYNFNVFGFEGIYIVEGITVFNSLEEAVEGVDFVIAPLPASTDDEKVNTSFYGKPIYYNDVYRYMTKNQLLIGGKISERITNLSKIYNIFTVDYFKREELIILNAIPTAEGAIQIAMEELPITIHSSRCLVLGYGRIGKVLSRMLCGLGAIVTVEARNHKDIAWINSYGYDAVHINNLAKVIHEADVIFNTIPNIVLNNKMLSLIKKDCLVIDLASKPGGVDLEIAKSLGVKTIWALSLPGKVAPNTAGDIIKHTILNIIDELGV